MLDDYEKHGTVSSRRLLKAWVSKIQRVITNMGQEIQMT